MTREEKIIGFANRLRLAKDSLGMTNKAFAEAVKENAANVSMWLSGKSGFMSSESFAKACIALPQINFFWVVLGDEGNVGGIHDSLIDVEKLIQIKGESQTMKIATKAILQEEQAPYGKIEQKETVIGGMKAKIKELEEEMALDKKKIIELQEALLANKGKIIGLYEKLIEKNGLES